MKYNDDVDLAALGKLFEGLGQNKEKLVHLRMPDGSKVEVIRTLIKEKIEDSGETTSIELTVLVPCVDCGKPLSELEFIQKCGRCNKLACSCLPKCVVCNNFICSSCREPSDEGANICTVCEEESRRKMIPRFLSGFFLNSIMGSFVQNGRS